MKYKAREGVVLTKLCGMNVLIPTRAAFDSCHTIQPLPLLWAATWDCLAKGKPTEEIIQVHQILTKKSREEIVSKLEQFYEDLANKGFAIRCEDEKRTDAHLPTSSDQDTTGERTT